MPMLWQRVRRQKLSAHFCDMVWSRSWCALGVPLSHGELTEREMRNARTEVGVTPEEFCLRAIQSCPGPVMIIITICQMVQRICPYYNIMEDHPAVVTKPSIKIVGDAPASR